MTFSEVHLWTTAPGGSSSGDRCSGQHQCCLYVYDLHAIDAHACTVARPDHLHAIDAHACTVARPDQYI